jgi:ribonuclease D
VWDKHREANSFYKPFRKIMDMFDPSDDKWLMACLVYRDVYNLREELARKQDVNKNTVCSDLDLILIAKARPVSL